MAEAERAVSKKGPNIGGILYENRKYGAIMVKLKQLY